MSTDQAKIDKNRRSKAKRNRRIQRFFNFAYSIGAAIVIWGALFKILHLEGGNELLAIGMGTEVVMFILTAFDRPPREYEWEMVYPELDYTRKTQAELAVEEQEALSELAEEVEDGSQDDDESDTPRSSSGAGVVVIGGTAGAAPAPHSPAASVAYAPTSGLEPGTGITDATVAYVDQLSSITADLQRLHESTAALNTVSETLLQSYRAITENSEDINRSSTGYVEQMADLSRNIQGLNTIYEIQLKSISSQIDSIDRVNKGIKDIRDMYEKSAEQSERYCRETEKMARYMQQLNSVYEKMITAMTINMYNPMMNGAAMPPNSEMPQRPANDDPEDEA